MDLDVLYLADLRFPGGSTTSLKYDIRACKQAGLKAGIIPLSSPLFARNQVLNAALIEEIHSTGTVIVPRTERPRAKVALLYHPSLLDKRVTCRTGFDAETFYLVVHHTTRDRRGRANYQTEHWSDLATDWFGHRLKLLPVSKIVRKDLELNGFSHALHDSDWTNLIDPSDFPGRHQRLPNSQLVIGRHSRPSSDKWPSPSVAQECYPASPNFAFRMMGASQSYLDQFETIPSNWQVLPFSKLPITAFLQDLDVYSYFHSDSLVEAFGYCVLEALASGLPCVVPHYLQDIFGDACFYAEPEQAPKVYDRLLSSCSMMEKASKNAAAFAKDTFGLDQFTRKFDLVCKTSNDTRPAIPKGQETSAKPVVLSVTSNGVGLGHLSRQLAITTAIGPCVDTVFFSMSEAIEVARSMGHLAEFRPFSRRLELDPEIWNAYFFQELLDALNFYKPSLVLFDGSVPYAGFLGAVEAHGKCPSVWIRRGLWRTDRPQSSSLDGHFDAVFEPGELCHAMDPGHVGNDPERVTKVQPVLLTHPNNQLGKAQARQELNLPDKATLCLVQLGSEANFDMTLARQVLLEFLDRQPDTIAVEVRSPLHIDDRTDFHERLLSRKIFPLGRYLKAFDYAVCAAGYNTFHENIAAALPTLFVPNNHPEMDLQEARAGYGSRAGWNLSCSADDPYGIGEKLQRLSNPEERKAMSLACARNHDCWKGASQIAQQLRILAQLPDTPIKKN
ncbi:glycosyltransferase [Roseibium sp. SCPC15]|uniref:glycosyltransferase n=1 Tax=Roseibium sp. SCP15 TaxID=3141376 RepID=UPI003337CDAA